MGEALRSEIKKHRDLLSKSKRNTTKFTAARRRVRSSLSLSLESRGCEGSLINIARPLP